MDKSLFKAYVRELVREEIEDSVEKHVSRILPKLLAEAVSQIKGSSSMVSEGTSGTGKRPAIDRSRLKEMMGLEPLNGTISANTGTVGLPISAIPDNVSLDDPRAKDAVEAIGKNYSSLMKKMGLV